MKQIRNSVLLFLLFQTITGVAVAQKKSYPLPKKAPALLQEDFILLRNILEANHPSLYWYTPKDSMDAYFEQGINGITDSLDEVQFKNKVAWVVSKIRCGHTSVHFSKAFMRHAERYRYPSFPLNLKAWRDSLVVLNSLRPKDSVFKRGTIITGINGRNNRQLLDTFFSFLSSDGYAFNYKNQAVSGNFPAWYKTILGVDNIYHISYIDSTGKESVADVKNFSPSNDSTGKQKGFLPAPFQKPNKRQLRKLDLLDRRDLSVDTTRNTAIMRLSTFSGGGLRRFFRQSFKKIKQRQVQHLVIDLRENGGGKVSSSILLNKYLSDHPFKVGDSVVAISRKFRYGRYIRKSMRYWFAMNFGAHKMPDGMIHFRRYEKKLFAPKEKYHFNGRVILLQGGFSFSATTMFIANLKGQKNVTLAGEETGGGYYGNSAMYLPTIKLPNSGLQISLPMYRLVMNSTRLKGHGIPPDITIEPSSVAIKKGVDLKMERVKEMIQQKVF